MKSDTHQQEGATGELFRSLFTAYDAESYSRSVALFQARFEQEGFDTGWFHGKRCLDAGCGGGRYSIALALLGAAAVTGVDLNQNLLADATARAAALDAERVSFSVCSVATLPFPNATFDFVCHSGVLQHTADPVAVVHELARVLKPGGMIYMLVYATEGLRWPLVQMLRPIAQQIGLSEMDAAVAAAGLDVRRRRTLLDDLFVPYIDFYSWPSLHGLLVQAGFGSINRWTRGRLDHEETVDAYVLDLRGFVDLFEAVGASTSGEAGLLGASGAAVARSVVEHADHVRQSLASGTLSDEEARRLLIGQGHHRLTAIRS